jgi:hypothetical protein
MTYRQPTLRHAASASAGQSNATVGGASRGPGGTAARRGAVLLPSVLLALAIGTAATPMPAAANTTGLSDGIVQPVTVNQASAVFAYDPSTPKWTELGNVTWKPVSSAGHSGYLIEATAPKAGAVSTFKVVIAGSGIGATSVEVYMTPTSLLHLTAGQTTTLRINLF